MDGARTTAPAAGKRVTRLVQTETSESLGSESQNLALKFRRRLFEAEPTAVLQQMIAASDHEDAPANCIPIHKSLLVRQKAAEFLQSRPEFNIRTQSILPELEKAGSGDPSFQEAADSLRLLQRVQALTPVPEAIAPLI